MNEEEANLRELVELKDMQIGAILEITQAINDNIPEKSLYKIYQFLLLANLRIRKLALFVFDEYWECKVNFGTEKSIFKIDLPEEYKALKKETYYNDRELVFGEFNVAVPVFHKKKLLGLVFVGESSFIGPSAADSKESVIFFKSLTNIIVVAVENKKLARKQRMQEAYKRELEIARQVQLNLIPKLQERYDQFDLSAYYKPFHEVGGDYYDFFEVAPDKYLLCIADVSGKGVPAAMMMSNFQASLRALAKHNGSLQEMVFELNGMIKQRGNGELFITVFVGFLNTDKRKLEYVNCGHNPPILCADDEVRELKKGTTILGVFDDLPFLEFGEEELTHGAILSLYTDGVSETENSAGVEFGEERFHKIVKNSTIDSSDAINNRVIYFLQEFSEGTPYKDDITLLTLKMF